MHSAAYAVVRCLSVCRLSVTFVYGIETSKRVLKVFRRLVDPPFWFLRAKRYGNIRTETP